VDGVWQILAFSRGRRAPGPMTETVPPWVDSSTSRVPFRPADSVMALREVMQTERAFSDSAGGSVQAAFASFAAPDAAKLGAGSAYVFGPEAIAALFAGPPPSGGGPLWTPEVGAVASSGDLGFTTGPVVARRPAEGRGPPAGAKYFTIWRRMPNGEWRYVVD
jgi:ketosteroid isomerase-like protein